jgi:integrase
MQAGEIPINQGRQAEVPRARQSKIKPWPPEIYGAFLDHLDQTKDRMVALFHLAGHVGLRRGELCGLRWEGVDLDNRVLVVRRQIADAGSQLVVSRPKTRSGEDRWVDLEEAPSRYCGSGGLATKPSTPMQAWWVPAMCSPGLTGSTGTPPTSPIGSSVSPLWLGCLAAGSTCSPVGDLCHITRTA